MKKTITILSLSAFLLVLTSIDQLNENNFTKTQNGIYINDIVWPTTSPDK
jgi:hypothetical protein